MSLSFCMLTVLVGVKLVCDSAMHAWSSSEIYAELSTGLPLYCQPNRKTDLFLLMETFYCIL